MRGWEDGMGCEMGDGRWEDGMRGWENGMGWEMGDGRWEMGDGRRENGLNASRLRANRRRHQRPRGDDRSLLWTS